MEPFVDKIIRADAVSHKESVAAIQEAITFYTGKMMDLVRSFPDRDDPIVAACLEIFTAAVVSALPPDQLELARELEKNMIAVRVDKREGRGRGSP